MWLCKCVLTDIQMDIFIETYAIIHLLIFKMDKNTLRSD